LLDIINYLIIYSIGMILPIAFIINNYNGMVNINFCLAKTKGVSTILLRIRGQIEEVEVSPRSLCCAFSYLLIGKDAEMKDRVFLWHGKDAGRVDKAHAVNLAIRFKDEDFN